MITDRKNYSAGISHRMINRVPCTISWSGDSWFVSSSFPNVIGAGDSEGAAIRDWLVELHKLRDGG